MTPATGLRAQLTDLSVLMIAVILGLLSRVVPKERGLIVFHPTFEPRGYSGNLKAVFEHIGATSQRDRLLWLTRSRDVARALSTDGRPVHYSRQRSLWPLLRAELIVLDSTEPRLAFGCYRMVQLWHGSGIKRIGLQREGLTWWRRIALRSHFGHYALIAATSERDRLRKIECFASENVEITGAPRADPLVSRSAAPAPASRCTIAYCPTFRRTPGRQALSPEGWRALDQWLVQVDGRMLVKRHVRDARLAVPAGLQRVRDVTGDVADVQALLLTASVLVTDYSSISTDFALTGKPIVFYVPDEPEGADETRFFAELRSLLPGPFAGDEAALIAALADLNWFEDPDYAEAYHSFRTAFHACADGQATVRTSAALLALMH